MFHSVPPFCSDSNHVCCTNCSYSPTTKVCRSFPTVNSLCYGNVFCDGTKEVCPSEVPPLPVDSPCRGSGRCLYNGTVCSAKYVFIRMVGVVHVVGGVDLYLC